MSVVRQYTGSEASRGQGQLLGRCAPCLFFGEGCGFHRPGTLPTEGIAELKAFAVKMLQGKDAVVAAMVLPYSQGQTEGRANKLKLIKRSMYGRGRFDLLRERVLYASAARKLPALRGVSLNSIHQILGRTTKLTYPPRIIHTSV